MRTRQIGIEVGRKGMDDGEIIPLLHKIGDVTFCSRDEGYFKENLRHPRYCLVVLGVSQVEAASYLRRLLRHPRFRRKQQRLGSVIRVAQQGIRVWKTGAAEETFQSWLSVWKNTT
jgi:hypothetical protein